MMETSNKELRETFARIETQLSTPQVGSHINRFFAALKRDVPEPVLLVKLNVEQNSRLTEINPVGLDVFKFREVDKKSVKGMKIQVECQLGEKYVVTPSLKKPKLRVSNINAEDINMDDSEEEIVDLIFR